MTRFLLALAAAAALGNASASADPDQPVVVELYTSQGCSSCPPADGLLEELAARDDVIALALHVDYWDYIGWKDTFAQPLYTQRQKGYAKAAGHRTIYTPQMVIGGRDHVVGFRPMEVAHLIEDHLKAEAPARIVLARTGDDLSVDIQPQGKAPGPMVVQLVRFEKQKQVSIGSGENAGRTIDYVNVVTEWKRLAEWDGVAPLSLKADCDGPAAVAVIVQQQGFGPILAASALR